MGNPALISGLAPPSPSLIAAGGAPGFQDPLILLAGVVVLGILAQWLAWRINLPSILVLLLTGIVVGSSTGLFDPDDLLGDLLRPIISLSVAVILYEGGLTLRLAELKDVVGRVVRNLVTIGLLVTWVLAAVAARFLFDLPVSLAVLLGAVLVVTGPTVIQPLLHHIRPSGPAGKILKWEGIVIDPIGALLAVLVFEVVLTGDILDFPALAAEAILKTILVGGAFGLLGAVVLVLFLHRYWVPDVLQNPLSLALALAAYAASDMFQAEAGLFAVTLMGIAVANQRWVEVWHIIEFKENVRVLLISGLFVLLGARLRIEQVMDLGWGGIVFVAFLVLAVRPLSVALSTIGSGLKTREKVFLAWMAPRGIVAAAISSVFALELEQAGYEAAGLLVPITFAVILGTVALYGLTAPLAAIRLRLAEKDPQGMILVGGHAWQRALAKALRGKGIPVLVVDTNRENVARARMEGLSAYCGNILGESFFEDVDMGGMGRLLGLTPSHYVNELAAQRFARSFGKANVFRLPARRDAEEEDRSEVPGTGRPLFEPNVTHDMMEHLMDAGAEMKVTPLSETFDFAAYKERYGEDALVLFVLGEDGKVRIVTADESPSPLPGEMVIGLVFDDRREDAAEVERVEAEAGQPPSPSA